MRKILRTSQYTLSCSHLSFNYKMICLKDSGAKGRELASTVLKE